MSVAARWAFCRLVLMSSKSSRELMTQSKSLRGKSLVGLSRINKQDINLLLSKPAWFDEFRSLAGFNYSRLEQTASGKSCMTFGGYKNVPGMYNKPHVINS